MTRARPAALAALAAAFLAPVSPLPADEPWPGPAFISVSAWEASALGPGGGTAVRASFGLEGLARILPGWGGAVYAGYAWAAAGPAAAGHLLEAGVEASYRFSAADLLALRPVLAAGVAGDPVSGALGPVLEAGLSAGVRLSGRDYLCLAPRVRWAGLPSGASAGAPVFVLGLSLRSEAAWPLPVPRALPRLCAEPSLFSPDGDGEADELALSVALRARDYADSWELEIRDPAGNRAFSRSGTGAPPASFAWDGKDASGTVVEPGPGYEAGLRLRDVLGREELASVPFAVDLLVFREGGRYKVLVPPVRFSAGSAELGDEDAAEFLAENRAVLEKLVALFARFPDYSVVIEGHANAVRWRDPAEMDREQAEELLPLSRARAETVRAALVGLGMAPARISTDAKGASEPKVPFSAPDAGRNRRVEFVLEKGDAGGR